MDQHQDQVIAQLVDTKVRTIKDHPKVGINFRDICPLVKDPVAMNTLTNWFVGKIKDIQFDSIAGLESRGFIFGPLIAYALGKGFVPIRKKNKLPGDKVQHTYKLEYGEDTIEMQSDSLFPGEKVLILDDLIATGGTAGAAVDLVEKVGGQVVGYLFVIELKGLEGRSKLKPDVPVIVAFAE